MRLGSFVAAFTFLVCSLSANAGVIYEWKPVKKQLPSQFSMSLEFDRATVESGSFSLHVRGDDTHILPGSGLIRFCVPYNCYSPRNEPFNHDYGFGFFDIDVTFIQGGFLSGSLRLYDFQMELEMASGFGGTPDHLFTIYKADADYGMGDCGGATGIVCSGGTGHIRQVSEPASLALLGVGVVSAFVNRRRKVKI